MLNRREAIAAGFAWTTAAMSGEVTMPGGSRSGMADQLPFVAPDVKGFIVRNASGRTLEPGRLVIIDRPKVPGSLPLCIGYANAFRPFGGVVIADNPVPPGRAFALGVSGTVTIATSLKTSDFRGNLTAIVRSPAGGG